MKKYTFGTQVAIAILGFSTLLCGCNTMEGAGKDIQRAGKALEKSAEKNK